MKLRKRNNRAAFETVSKVFAKPVNRESHIDLRTVRLPRESFVDDFEPRDHREPKSPISVWMAYFNLIRTGFGAGMLGLPLAVSQTGIVFGPVLMISTGLLITYMHWTLLDSLNEISRRLKVPYISYRYGFRIAVLHGPEMVHCIGRCGPAIIATFMLLSQCGICTVFVAFTSDSLKDLMDTSNVYYALLALLPPYLIMAFFMKTLKIISYVSMFGNVSNLLGLILVFVQIFRDPRKQFKTFDSDVMSALFAYGVMLFNMSAVSVILSLDKALQNPKVMSTRCGVINVGMLVPLAVATVFSICGYWSFGTMEDNILRSLPYDDDVSLTAISLYLIAVAFAYPIQSFPAIQMVLEIFKNRMEEQPSNTMLKIVETTSRLVFVLITFCICWLVPFQAPIVAFVGHLCTTMLALVFPALMELCLRYPDDFGMFKVHLIKDVCIILGGLVTWIVGCVLSIYLIYIRVLSLKSPNARD